MKKLFLFFFLSLMMAVSVSATYWCGDGLCEADYCPGDCSIFLSSYCEGLIEPYECDALCGSELGWIRPPDCLDYGYHLECDSCCIDGVDCDSCCAEGFPDRAGVETFCRGYGFIRPEDCPVMSEADCISGYGLFSDCPFMSEENCIARYSLLRLRDCPTCIMGGYERCDSCCKDDCPFCPFQWWLLLIGGIVGYFIRNLKKEKK